MNEPETVETTTRDVRCDGGGGALGHPRVYLTVGAEIQLAAGLTLRPGYSLQQSGLDGDEALGLATGAGLDVRGMRFDYAYASFPALGTVHRISLSGKI